MLFSSLTFLFVFLPLVFAAYFLASREFKNWVLLFASVVFYAWGNFYFLPVILFCIFANYFGAILIEKSASPAARKTWLFLTVSADLALLFLFKYSAFFCENLNRFFGADIHFKALSLPIGISFFVFQSISYAVDVYRKSCEAQKDFAKLALYVAFFPQLIAGPIVKYHDIALQIERRNENFDDFSEGIHRFVLGLAKKILIADCLGAFVDEIFSLPVGEFSQGSAFFAAIAYTLQIFYDFSGYSDMAIGLAKVFGFRILENFDSPYISRSIGEFWRRWHISLSSWFKEYVYIPLGGNRRGFFRTILNLSVVFLLTGIWHGAAWHFIAWGIWNGFFVCAEKIIARRWKPKFAGGKIFSVFSHFYCIAVFVAGWVIFRSDGLHYAYDFLKVLLGVAPIKAENLLFSTEYYFTAPRITAFFAGIIFCHPAFKRFFQKRRKSKFANFARDAVLLAAFVLSIVRIASGTNNAFIYFQF